MVVVSPLWLAQGRPIPGSYTAVLEGGKLGRRDSATDVWLRHAAKGSRPVSLDSDDVIILLQKPTALQTSDGCAMQIPSCQSGRYQRPSLYWSTGVCIPFVTLYKEKTAPLSIDGIQRCLCNKSLANTRSV